MMRRLRKRGVRARETSSPSARDTARSRTRTTRSTRTTDGCGTSGTPTISCSGFAGPRAEAEEIKGRLGTFLRDHAQAGTVAREDPDHPRRDREGPVPRLRYLDVINNPAAGNGHGHIASANARRQMTRGEGRPVHAGWASRPTARNLPAIATSPSSASTAREYRGFVQYYAYAANRFWLPPATLGHEVPRSSRPWRRSTGQPSPRWPSEYAAKAITKRAAQGVPHR